MGEIVHIDFETYSEVNLKVEGSYRYFEHPSTEVQIFGYQMPGEDTPYTITNVDEMVRFTQFIASTPYQVAAWNVAFEYGAISKVLKQNCLLDFNRWVDPMVMAAAMALPQPLMQCGMALKLPKDQSKDKRGKYLISKLCVPQRNGERLYDDELFEEFQGYCRQDVVAEKTIHDMLIPLSPTERKVWVQDMQINHRGIPVDREYCRKATWLFKTQKEHELARLKELTNLDNPNSPAQLKAWLLEQGLEVPDLKSATVRDYLDDPEIKGVLNKALALRATASRTPPTKYATFIKKSSKADSRFRGALTYHGASTGRWSSRGVNFQNLPRPKFKDQAHLAEDIRSMDRGTLDIVYGGMEALCSGIRSAVCASEGKRLIVSDYASIEARMIAWLAGSTKLLEVFNTHGKVYEHTASGIYRKPLDKITGEERFVGKTATLALGYQGGYRAFVRMAKAYGVDFSEERAKKIVPQWRESNPEIVQFWYACQDAALKALRNPNVVVRVRTKAAGIRPVAYRYVQWKGVKYLCCRLPSGKIIYYVKPFIGEGKYGEVIKFYGVDSNRQGAWAQLDTYGGKLVENITQGSSRDFLANALLNMRGTVYGDGLVLHVHDEVVSEVDEGIGSVEEMSEIMCLDQPWAKGLPAEAKGYESKRYMK